jgi:hypothetical protein
MITIGSVGCHDNLPENILPCCRVCLTDFSVNARGDVANIGCKCQESCMMCHQCTVKWLTTSINFHFTQHRPDKVSHNNIVNEWPQRFPLSANYVDKGSLPLLQRFFSVKQQHQKMQPQVWLRSMRKSLAKGISAGPIALKISRIPGYTSIPMYSDWCKCDCQIFAYHPEHKRHRYSNLGKRTCCSNKEVEDLGAPFIWQPDLAPSRFFGWVLENSGSLGKITSIYQRKNAITVNVHLQCVHVQSISRGCIDKDPWHQKH